jgi:hypothetical protein
LLIARNLFFAVFISTILSLMLSFLPSFTAVPKPESQSVFKSARINKLSTNNLVDVLSATAMHHNMKHVEWQNNNLFIDFKVDVDKPVYIEEIYEDLYSALNNNFRQISNVQRLYVRFVYESKGKDEVLIAMSSEKSKVQMEAMSKPLNMEGKKAFLADNTELSYGVLWTEKLVE